MKVIVLDEVTDETVRPFMNQIASHLIRSNQICPGCLLDAFTMVMAKVIWLSTKSGDEKNLVNEAIELLQEYVEDIKRMAKEEESKGNKEEKVVDLASFKGRMQ